MIDTGVDSSNPDPNKQGGAKRNAAQEMLKTTMRVLAHEMYADKKEADLIGLHANPLQPGYINERSDYLIQKSDQDLRGTTTKVKARGAGWVDDQQIMARGDPTSILNLEDGLETILTKSFDDLTNDDHRQLHNHFSDNPHSWLSPGNKKNVFFARKAERLSNLMLIPFQGKLYTTNGVLFNSTQAAYSIDKYGNIMVEDIAGGVREDETAQFNHSTLVAGARVTCAGTLTCVDGELTKIDSDSGHYKPSDTMLSNGISHLASCGLPVDRTLTEIHSLATGNTFTPIQNVNNVTSPVAQVFGIAHPSIDPV